MNRRDLLQATVPAAAAATLGIAESANTQTTQSPRSGRDRELYEWRTYRFDETAKSIEGADKTFRQPSPDEYKVKHDSLHKYLKSACLPAWQRMGVGPVGVFTEIGPDAGPSIHVLLTYPKVALLATAREWLEGDPEYRQAAADHLIAQRDDPAYDRIESWLMLAFIATPKITPPAKKPRVLELRTYENHSESVARRKIDMFNDGECDIFPKCGFENVFFGETLIGSGIPSLKYMLAAPDLDANAAGWKKFLAHPDFVRMRDDPKYADTQPNITKLFLQPTEYSQV